MQLLLAAADAAASDEEYFGGHSGGGMEVERHFAKQKRSVKNLKLKLK